MSDFKLANYSGSGGSGNELSGAVVTLVESDFAYDGTLKTQEVESVILDGLTLLRNREYIVTNNSATNAGTYNLVILGIGGYSGSSIKVPWTIAKAPNNAEVSDSSLLLYDTTPVSITVTRDGNGVISCSSNDSSVVIASVDSSDTTKINITPINGGTTTITINIAEDENYKANSITIDVVIYIISNILAENSPEEIQYAAINGLGANFWSIGDQTAPININAFANMNATSACAFIIGFDHNSSKEETGIHFQFGKTTDGTDIAFCDSGYLTNKKSDTWFNIDNSDYNSGGWAGSHMCTTVCPAFLSALPAIWQNVITVCTKYTATGINSVCSTKQSRIWLLGQYEVFGTSTSVTYTESSNQEQYAYYANGNSKVKYKHDLTNRSCLWLLRSPNYSYSNYFRCVTSSGSEADISVPTSCGFAPGFLVGALPDYYGASWDRTSSTSLNRTGLAAGFSDPNPALSGGTGSSPFDNIMPWSGIVRETINGNEMVKIPKFYYRWINGENNLELQISDHPKDGFHVSPAHADRGDGKGERDYVYIGRYHCASDYKSKTGVKPITYIPRATARSGCNGVGTGFSQLDYAMWWTVRMLYLVEFADWDSQVKIGYGCGDNSSAHNSGASDSARYHTGSMQSSRTTYGSGIQYRYIEDPWGNVYDWCDGIVLSNKNAYVTNVISNYGDSTSNHTKVGTGPSSNEIAGWNVPTISGLEWALFPSQSTKNYSYNTYCADYVGTSDVVVSVGGYYSQYKGPGLFCSNGNYTSYAYSANGARLQYLP